VLGLIAAPSNTNSLYNLQSGPLCCKTLLLTALVHCVLAVCTDRVPIGVYGSYGIALSAPNKLIRDIA